MKASFFPRALTMTLAALLCTLSLASCKATLKPGQQGLQDTQTKITYSHASTVYEATALVKEYGKLALTSKESHALYTIPGADSSQFLATEDLNILYAQGVTMPSLTDMKPHLLQLCADSMGSIREIHRLEDPEAIASLVQAFTTGESLTYPADTPLRSYKARFSSIQYPGFYYSLTYIEYAQDVEIDGVNYGRFFLRSAFDQIFIPVGDEIHSSMGFTD